jgi:hypothetical protein
LLLEASTLAAVAALSIAAAIVGGMGGFGTGVILAAALVPAHRREGPGSGHGGRWL